MRTCNQCDEKDARLEHLGNHIDELEAQLKKEKQHNNDLLTESKKSWAAWEEAQQENAKLEAKVAELIRRVNDES